MSIVWFIAPVKVTKWLWEAQGIYNVLHQTSSLKKRYCGQFWSPTTWQGTYIMSDVSQGHSAPKAIQTEPVRANPLDVKLDVLFTKKYD